MRQTSFWRIIFKSKSSKKCAGIVSVLAPPVHLLKIIYLSNNIVVKLSILQGDTVKSMSQMVFCMFNFLIAAGFSQHCHQTSK